MNGPVVCGYDPIPSYRERRMDHVNRRQLLQAGSAATAIGLLASEPAMQPGTHRTGQSRRIQRCAWSETGWA